MRKYTRTRSKALGLAELIAIALGGMVGGGIFSILGVSVEHVGNATPIAIMVGGILAFFAAFSYVKLAILYKDEGATYSFFRKTFPHSPFASSVIGWFVVFGYISTLALYAFTFSSYLCSQFPVINIPLYQKLVAGGIILLFAVINVVSVRGMGKIEDWLVYTKIVLLLFISGLLIGKGDIHHLTPMLSADTKISSILVVASVTFVAYEGFQLVIHAYREMEDPVRNIPRAIYGSIAIATLLYVVLSIGALSAIPQEAIVEGKEYALAAGAQQYVGKIGLLTVILGALLATSSAISGTLFGASRLMAVIAEDGYLPRFLGHKIKGFIPDYALVVMSILAFVLILTGSLQVILEFGSITFILVSFLMAWSNFIKRRETHTHGILAVIAMLGLLGAGLSIFYFEYKANKEQLIYIVCMYLILTAGAYVYARKNNRRRIPPTSP